MREHGGLSLMSAVHLFVKEGYTIKRRAALFTEEGISQKPRGFVLPNLLLLFRVTADGFSHLFVMPLFLLYLQLLEHQAGFDLLSWAEKHPSPWAVSVKHNITHCYVLDELR